MTLLNINDLIVPSEFILTADCAGRMMLNAHYVIEKDPLDNTYVKVVYYNGKNVELERRVISLRFFVDNPNSFKPFSLQQFNNIKAFL